jgi:hypothetical protein
VVRAISVRLEDEAQRVLASLEAAGMSQPQAIRKALIDSAAALHRREAEAIARTADPILSDRGVAVVNQRGGQQPWLTRLPGRSATPARPAIRWIRGKGL